MIAKNFNEELKIIADIEFNNRWRLIFVDGGWDIIKVSTYIVSSAKRNMKELWLRANQKTLVNEMNENSTFDWIIF